MSNTVKLSSKLAESEDLNGLDALAGSMIDDPRRVRVALVWFDTQKVVSNTDDESEVPYARIRRFEPIGDADNPPQGLAELVARSVEERTGKAPLPFDAVDGIEVE